MKYFNRRLFWEWNKSGRRHEMAKITQAPKGDVLYHTYLNWNSECSSVWIEDNAELLVCNGHSENIPWTDTNNTIM